jgi:ankyrin repeat protein
MSRELRNALVSLICGGETDSIMEEMHALIASYTEKDLQEAVLVKGYLGWLPIHVACYGGAPVEVIRLLLDSDDDNTTILAKTSFGQLPIHFACYRGAPV